MELLSLRETAKKLGVGYHRVYYATLIGAVWPRKVGRARIFTEADVEILGTYFEEKKRARARKMPLGNQHSEVVQ